MSHKMALAKVILGGASIGKKVVWRYNTAGYPQNPEGTQNVVASSSFNTASGYIVPYYCGTSSLSEVYYYIMNPADNAKPKVGTTVGSTDLTRWEDGDITLQTASNGVMGSGSFREFTAVSHAQHRGFYTEFIAEFPYKGSVQPFAIPVAGTYTLECWGAEGGNAGVMLGGMGGYTKGNIVLGGNKASTVYVYVGGHDEACNGVASVDAMSMAPKDASYSNAATNWPGGWNGGGTGGYDGDTNTTEITTWPNGNRGLSTNGSGNCRGLVSGGGGGATDIRLATGAWNINLTSRIMVAGGGGGGQGVYNVYYYMRTPTISGAGGGLIGYKGFVHTGTNPATYPYSIMDEGRYVNGGTQSAGGTLRSVSDWSTHSHKWANQDNLSAGGAAECEGSLGQGGKGNYGVNAWGGGGGGGGYYGGAGGVSYLHHYAGNSTCGAGGSSFIPGHTGCAAKVTYGGQDYAFSSTQMIDGLGRIWTTTSAPGESDTATMPNPDSSPTTRAFNEPVTGRVGNGFARITFVSE